MKRIELLIYIVVFAIIILLILKYRKTGRKN